MSENGMNPTASDNQSNSGITMYTTKWCPTCWQAKHVMKSMKVDYNEIDISKDADAAETVMQINKGFQSVPTIVFPDGTFLTEPHPHVLKKKLSAYT